MTDTDENEQFWRNSRGAFRATYVRYCNKIAKEDIGKNYQELDNSRKKQVFEKYEKDYPEERKKNPVTFENYADDVELLKEVKRIDNKPKKSKHEKQKKVETVEKDRVFVLSEDKPKACENIPYAKEEEIEVLLEKNIEILERDAFIIGRQVETGYGKRIDLVAMDKDANIIIIELKKAKTDHYVLSQIFDYWSWVEKLKQEEINDNIAKSEHNGKNHLDEFKSIEDKFTHHFKKKPTAWNSKQKLIIVGEQIDVQTKEQASSLAKRNVNVECVELNAYRNPQGTIVVVRYIPLQS